MTHLLDGVTVPLATPLDPELRPDPKAARPLLEAMAANGIRTIMLLGTNGEGALFHPDDSAAYARAVVAEWRALAGAGSRVFVTAFGSGTREVLERIDGLDGVAADAIVVPPPHYFVHTQKELVSHFRLAASSGRPIVVYNTPRYSGNPIGTDLLGELAQIEGVIGVKDSSGVDENLTGAIEIASWLPHFGVSSGNEKRLAWAVEQGAIGVTPGLANIAPALCLAIVAAAREGRREDAATIQAQLDGIARLHTIRPGVAAMKAALSLQGLIPNRTALPFVPYSDEELARLRELLAEPLGLS